MKIRSMKSRVLLNEIHFIFMSYINQSTAIERLPTLHRHDFIRVKVNKHVQELLLSAEVYAHPVNS